MLFQTLDEKEKCVAIFLDGKLYKDKIPSDLTQTWSYSSFLENYNNIQYANLYCGGKNLSEVCPEYLSTHWEFVHARLKAFYRSFTEAKISLNDNCFFDLVQDSFLLEYCDIKNQITQHVLENYEKPKNYDFLVDLNKLLTEIKYQNLNINLIVLKDRLSEYKVRKFVNKIKKIDPHIKYDMYGTKTGRLSTKKNSFPILTMDKTYRKILQPQNDWFVELDYNAAELRTLLSLSEIKQPKEDIHAWNAKNVYQGLQSREESKKRIFSWLYNPESKDYLSNRFYDRGKILEKQWDGKHVNTIFGRKIEADKFHALNYIIQSTTNDLILKQAIKIRSFLKGRKTKISFIIHDSIILDMSNDDQEIINDIYSMFYNTELGRFKTNVSAGRNFGDLKKLWIKS